jgi:hypothetical protein
LVHSTYRVVDSMDFGAIKLLVGIKVEADSKSS